MWFSWGGGLAHAYVDIICNVQWHTCMQQCMYASTSVLIKPFACGSETHLLKPLADMVALVFLALLCSTAQAWVCTHLHSFGTCLLMRRLAKP